MPTSAVPEQGRWLASVVRGHLASYAVPGNGKGVNAFRFVAIRHAWGAESRSSCRGEFILVDETAEQVAAGHLERLRRRLRSDR
jgi:hypothetical protein